jgi:4,5-DOPA dioxygenase extradiol
MSVKTFPSVFVSHGAPTLLLDQVPARSFLSRLGTKIGKPLGIICISAHWDTASPALSSAFSPETIYDFYGFPVELYKNDYPAPGDPALAAAAVDLIRQADLDVETDPGQGLDHGAWVPLMLMYPKADIPVVQLSVQSGLSADHHLCLGSALRPLRKKGILILASGGATHNLRDYRGQEVDSPPKRYASRFEQWLVGAVAAGKTDELINYTEKAPQAKRNHPTPEHFLPLLVALGAASKKKNGHVLHTGFTHGVLSMASFAWQ